jgi:hypothetical protein
MKRSTIAAPVLLLAAGLLASPVTVRAADCNANGSDDIADIASGASRDCNANVVPDECELAEGAIAYEARLGFSTGTTSDILTEDFDGDGDIDIVATELWSPRVEEPPPEEWDPSVVFLRNLGGGTFAAPERYPVTDSPNIAEAEDLDGDADLDLLVLITGAGQLWVYRNDGGGTFADRDMYDVPGWIKIEGRRNITRDMDGDGDRDVVLPSLGFDRITVLINQGDGTLSTGSSVAVVRPFFVEFGDVDADGDIDVVMDTASSPESLEASFVVLRNNGLGTSFERADYPLGAYPQEIALADIDGDGDPDFLAARGPSAASGRPRDVALFRNRGNGQFDQAPSLQPGHKAYLVRTADIDGDGDEDVLSASDGIYADRESLAIFINQGAGAFSSPVVHTVGDGPAQIEVRDLNRDGKPEILVLNQVGGSLSVLRNAGSGAFDAPVEFPTNGAGPRMSCADMDGDGDTDVATANWGADQTIRIVENITGGEFTQGCVDFMRGDVNTDGNVSLSDIIMLRRFLFDGAAVPACLDAADATDNDDLNLCDAIAILKVLLDNPGWSQSLAEPSLVAGLDPTPFGADPAHSCDGGFPQVPTLPLGCLAYDVEPPQDTADLVRIGDATAAPGEQVRLPIHLTTTLEIDAVQLVIEYDPSVLEIDPETAISFEDTFFGAIDNPFGLASVDETNGMLVAGIAGHLILSGREVGPGDDIRIGWLVARVKDDAPTGRVPVDLTNGPDGLGVGPYRLRNELTHKGEARFASFLPELEDAVLSIVGDQTLFVRGDSNGDEKVDISDAVRTLGGLFSSDGDLPCEDAGDANDDGTLDISDPIFTLNHLFQGGPAIPAPHPEAGADPTADGLYCFGG